MSQQVVDARIDFYNPVSGSLRYSLATNIRRIEIAENGNDEADDAGFELAHDFADLSGFNIGDECRVYIKTDQDSALTHIWTGVVDSIQSDRQGSTFADLPVKAQDYVFWLLARTYVTDTYADMTAGDIVRELLENYLPALGRDYVEDTAVTIDSITFNGESALSCLRRLAVLANASFKGDKNKQLHFFASATKSSGQSVGPESVVRGSFSLETSMADFGNVITVRGANAKVQDATSSGSFSSWTTLTALVRYQARVFFSKSRISRVDIWTNPSSPSALTGGLTVRIQADNAAGSGPTDANNNDFDLASTSLDAADLTVGGWSSFDLPNHIAPAGNYVWVIVESDSNSQRVGLNATPALMYRTFFDQPVIVQRQDDASISTYGRRELPPVFNQELLTEADAENFADTILAERSMPNQTGRYVVLDPVLEQAADTPAAAPDLTSARAGVWNLQETSGTTATDSSSTANHGTTSGSPTLGATGPGGAGPALAYTLDGVDDYVSIPDHASYSMVTTNGLSIAFWVKRLNLSPAARGAVFSKFSAGTYEYAVFLTTTGVPQIEITDSGAADTTITATTGISDSNWHHVVLTFGLTSSTAGTAKFYLDGVLDKSTSFTTPNAMTNTTAAVTLGQRNSSNWLNAGLCGVGVYNRVLTLTEIEYLALGELIPPIPAPILSLGGVPVGQTVSASFPKDGVPAGSAFIVDKKTHSYDADRGTYEQAHEVVNARRAFAAEDLLRRMQDRIRRIEDAQRPQGTLSVFSGVSDTAKFSASTAAVVDDPALLNSKVGSAVVGTHLVRP